MAKGNRKIIIIYILVLVALYLIVYTVPKLTGALKQTDTLEMGDLQVTQEAKCYFVRDEQVYTADKSGRLKYLVKEGVRVRKGTKVVELTGDGKVVPEGEDTPKSDYEDQIATLNQSVEATGSGTVAAGGVISYYIDGYEGYFTPENIKKLDPKELDKINFKSVKTRRDTTLKGEPLFKQMDNNNWNLVCWVTAESIQYYNKGDKVTVVFPDGDVEAEISEVNQGADDQWQVVFICHNYYKEFAKTRVVDVNIVAKEYSGLLVDNKSLTTVDGKPGLMVKDKYGKFQFTRVSVIGTDGEVSALKDTVFYDEDGKQLETVKAYDEVLRNPEKGN
ncbi:MAG: HlyD family efflux transporter periplasmic adaptor subunit [Anaerovoracaceae bacterium]